jgi:hypothetical protein
MFATPQNGFWISSVVIACGVLALVGPYVAAAPPERKVSGHAYDLTRLRDDSTRFVAGSPDRLEGVVAGVPPTAVLKLVPVPAKVGSYPPGTTLVGNELTAFTGGFRAWFEFKVRDWDPNGDNVPPLQVWQFEIDTLGYRGENADPPNPGVDLTRPLIPCANNAPCTAAFGEAWANCELGTCKAAYLDRPGTGRADSWCADTGSGACELADCDLASRGCFFLYPTGVGRPDAGIEYYAATVVLDIPTGAEGRYTVNLDPDATFLADTALAPNEIPTLAETGFVVNILPPTVQACCHKAGGCTDLDSADCANAGDTPQGQGTSCQSIQCPEPTGSCCDRSAFSCTDYVLEADCSPPLEWTPGVLCANLPSPCLPTGACCDRSPGGGGSCSDGLFLAQCTGSQRVWTQGETCADIVCEEARGPCCNPTTFACTNDVLQADCQGADRFWRTGATCQTCAPGPQMQLTPVPAKVGSYPPGTTIVGNELTALTGGFRAWFEFKVSHWDSNGDSVPALNGWQFKVDRDGFLGANADPPNPGVDLAQPVIACPDDAPCVAAFGEAWANCEPGTCNVAYVNDLGTGRADSWCADTGSGPCQGGACAYNVVNLLCYSYFPSGVGRPDSGIEYYGATLVLDIPAGANGRYTVNLDTDDTFLFDATLPSAIEIPSFSETGFVVHILTGACCDTLHGDCEGPTLQADCAGSHSVWTPGLPCDEVECSADTGACCDQDPFGGCQDATVLSDCQCPTCTWHKLETCADMDCVTTPIPAASTWGLAVLSLLLVIGAKVMFGQPGPRCYVESAPASSTRDGQ